MVDNICVWAHPTQIIPIIWWNRNKLLYRIWRKMCAEMRDDMEYYEFVDEMAEKIKMCFGKEVAVE